MGHSWLKVSTVENCSSCVSIFALSIKRSNRGGNDNKHYFCQQVPSMGQTQFREETQIQSLESFSFVLLASLEFVSTQCSIGIMDTFGCLYSRSSFSQCTIQSHHDQGDLWEVVCSLTCFSISQISVVLFEHRFIFQIALMSVYEDLEHFWLNSKTSLRVQLSKCEYDDTVIQTGNR